MKSNRKYLIEYGSEKYTCIVFENYLNNYRLFEKKDNTKHC